MSRTLIGLSLLIVCLVAAWPAVAPSSPRWLPIDRTEILALMTSGLDTVADEISSLDQFIEQERLRLASNARRLARLEERVAAMKAEQGDEDTIWLARGGNSLPFSFAMIGVGEQIHSLRIIVPVVNHSPEENELTYKALSTLFAAIYPDWPDAQDWPATSLKSSWGRFSTVERDADGYPVDPDRIFCSRDPKRDYKHDFRCAA